MAIGYVRTVCALVALTASAAFAANESPIAASRFGISIDGVQIASAKAPRGKLVQALSNPQSQAAAIAQTAPLELLVDASAPSQLLGWMQQSFTPSVAPRRTLELVSSTGKCGTLHEALLTELTVPALDASSMEPAYLVLKLAPRRVEIRNAAKVAIRATRPKPKRWLASNFRLELGGLPSKHVSKVDSFTWEQKIVETEASQAKPRKQPISRIQVPPLQVTVSATQAGLLRRWQQSKQVQAGHLDLLDTTGKRWARLALRGVHVQSVRQSTNSVQATLHVTSVALSP